VNSLLHLEMESCANRVLECDENAVPNGNLRWIHNTPLDFTQKKPMLSDFDYDHFLVVPQGEFDAKEMKELVVLYVKEGNEGVDAMKLIVKSNQPGFQLYSGNFLDGKFIKHQGICIEPSLYLNTPNVLYEQEDERDRIESTVLGKDQVLVQKTSYTFIGQHL